MNEDIFNGRDFVQIDTLSRCATLEDAQWVINNPFHPDAWNRTVRRFIEVDGSGMINPEYLKAPYGIVAFSHKDGRKWLAAAEMKLEPEPPESVQDLARDILSLNRPDAPETI